MTTTNTDPRRGKVTTVIHIPGRIDGEEFARQRYLICELANSPLLKSEHQQLLEGLTNLLDVIADDLHDRHGIECLMKERYAPGDLTAAEEG